MTWSEHRLGQDRYFPLKFPLFPKTIFHEVLLRLQKLNMQQTRQAAIACHVTNPAAVIGWRFLSGFAMNRQYGFVRLCMKEPILQWKYLTY